MNQAVVPDYSSHLVEAAVDLLAGVLFGRPGEKISVTAVVAAFGSGDLAVVLV